MRSQLSISSLKASEVQTVSSSAPLPPGSSSQWLHAQFTTKFVKKFLLSMQPCLKQLRKRKLSTVDLIWENNKFLLKTLSMSFTGTQIYKFYPNSHNLVRQREQNIFKKIKVMTFLDLVSIGHLFAFILHLIMVSVYILPVHVYMCKFFSRGSRQSPYFSLMHTRANTRANTQCTQISTPSCNKTTHHSWLIIIYNPL